MATSNYKAALKSIRAIQEGRQKARNEAAMAGLMGSAERERDRVKAEKEQERMERRKGIANVIGTTAGIAAGVLGTPVLGAVVGGATTMAGRGVASAGWKDKNNNLTFQSNRDALRKSLKPNVAEEISIGANAAATGYQAGRLMDSIAIKGALANPSNMIPASARESDFTRRGFKLFMDKGAVRSRMIENWGDVKEVPDWLLHMDEGPNPSTRLNIRDILRRI